jgi:hypothetical protein
VEEAGMAFYRAAAASAIAPASAEVFLGLQKAMANREEALKVSEIIDEELRHVSVLNGLLRQIK